jgi:uncharacterized membrane-anchored protein
MTDRRPSTATTLFAAALIQSAILGWMVWDRIDLLRTGRPIVLDVAPVDPRDLFRGDYLVLSYPIARLRTDMVEGDKDFGSGDRVFVGLRKTETGAWQAFSIHHARPQLTGQVVFLRGSVTSVAGPATGDAPCTGDCKLITMRFGIESYFVPEGEGKRLEKLRNDNRLQVAARVTPDGEAAIAGLIIDGTLRYEEPLF